MERRRFVPSVDGLETRIALSGTTQALAARASVNNTGSTLPETVAQRMQRVQNLPFFMRQYQPDRTLPTEVTSQIQAALNAMITRLQPVPTNLLQNMNAQFRKVGSQASISENNSKSINNAFTKALQGAKADPAVLAKLSAAMLELTKVDAASPNPTFLLTNDFALVLQTALGIGRPLRAPNTPTLASSDRLNGAPNTSKTATPTLVGTYEADSIMTVVDGTGQVLGTTQALSNGQYSIKINRPLPDGSYKLTLLASDGGFVSLPSRAFTIKIRTPTVKAQMVVPRGPMGL